MKTNKQKCLEMWEWLAKNPGKTKWDYKKYLEKEKRGREFNTCWACREANEIFLKERPLNQLRLSPCNFCPIKWGEDVENCEEVGSPYYTWSDSANTTDSKFAAEEIVKLIKTTWEEEDGR